jgi:hypothetical protein
MRARRQWAACHDARMAVASGLVAAVDRAFAVTGRGLSPWPDPHPGRMPLDEEYSRLLDPAKWRILGARARAWMSALVDAGVAVVEVGAPVSWRAAPGPEVSGADRVVPRAAGALTLVVARSRLGDLDDAGVTLGVGEPAACVGWFPDCGCDACDSGSQDALDELDRHIRGIVTGTFRRLTRGARTIKVLDADGWSASGGFARGEVDAILADPAGWHELSGASWLGWSQTPLR